MVFPFELLMKIEADLSPLDEVGQKISQFGMRLRLTGRDLMRIGTTMDRFFSRVVTSLSNVFAASMEWSGAFEDIRWAVEDIGAAIGDLLTPILDVLVELFNYLADVVERVPWIQYAIAGLFVVAVIGKLIAALFTLAGTLNLYIGTLLVAWRAHLSLGQAIKALWIRAWEGHEAFLAYIEAQKHIINQQKVWASYTVKWSSDLGMYIWALNEACEAAKAAAPEEARTGLGKLQKMFSGLFAGLKRGLKTLFKFGLGFLGLGILFVLLSELMEPLEGLFGAILHAFEPWIDALRTGIEVLTDWIEEHPEMARNIILLIGGLGLLVFLLYKFGIAGKIAETVTKGVGGALEKATEPMKKMGESTWKTTLAQAALVAAVALLIYALTNFFGTLLSAGVGIWEAVGALAAVFAAIIAFIAGLSACLYVISSFKGQLLEGVLALLVMVGAVSLLAFAFTSLLAILSQLPGGTAALWELILVMTVAIGVLTFFAVILGTLAGPALLGAVVLLVLAAAVLVLAEGMTRLAVGLTLMNAGLLPLLEHLPEIFALGAALFALATGATALGLSSVLAAAGVFVLSAAVFALAAALSALLIPLGAIKLLGGEAAVVEAIKRLPTLQKGGIVEKTGIAVVHEGEMVIPPGGAPAGQIYNTFYISATIREEADINKLAKEINRLQKTEIGRTR